MKRTQLASGVLVALLGLSGAGFAQGRLPVHTRQIHEQRRPATNAEENTKQPTYDYYSILNGLPMGMEIHHDTLASNGKPIDVVKYSIELQVFNSDGNLEPEGLIISHFYTMKPIQPGKSPNPHDTRDCAIWNNLVLDEIKNRDNNSPTWSYVEFLVAQGARTIQTNEDGTVFWSDDIECWGARDRFPPF